MRFLPNCFSSKATLLCAIFFLCGAILLTPPALEAETIPAGTPLELRLLQPISSYSTPKGTRISAVLVAPVNVAGHMVLPLGTRAEGTILSVRKVGLGVMHETAEIELHWDRILLDDGTAIPISAKVTQVENAREGVKKNGDIQGIRSTSTLSHRTSGLVGTLAFGDPIAVIFTTAGSSSVLRFSEPEISLPIGAEMLAEFTAPVNITPQPSRMPPPLAQSARQIADLRQMVRSLPFRTITQGSEIPSDLTNLAFIGSADAVERAFTASGWDQVDDLTAQSTYLTVRSIAENQGYRRAPMSTLLLGGNPPQYAYAKTLNTFSKRHHLRIWKTGEIWDGQTVWTSSSTHDIGIGFSKANKTFIHLIDTHIDNERAKVVNDMVLTGCVTAVQLVDRPWVPRDATNGTKEPLITDGKIAVMELNNCDSPREKIPPETMPLQVHGNAMSRGTRQTVLTLKNNILRDNVGVMAYSGIRYAVDAKKHHSETGTPREIAAGGQEYHIQQEFQPNDSYVVSPANTAQNAASSTQGRNPWSPPAIEIGLHSGWLGYAGGNGGLIGYLFEPPNTDGFLLLVLGNSFSSGWTIGGTVTLNPQKYFSHEFSFDYSLTTFHLGLAVIDNQATSESLDSQFAFASSGLRTSQFTYNFLLNATPKTARWRPYVAVGPSLELMHLDDAPVKKAPGWFKLGLSNIGLLAAAYNFGSDPPLEGGGIFRVGLNYGGGVRYRLTPRWMLRADYRETLIKQPDFWSKSRKDILAGIDAGDYQLTEIGPLLNGPMRQMHATAGVSFTF